MTEEGIRKEWCEKQRINYINFRDSKEVEDYIVYLENKIVALNIDSVDSRRELYCKCSLPNEDADKECCTKCGRFIPES